MITQRFEIRSYGWLVGVYYFPQSQCDIGEVISRIKQLGCQGSNLRKAKDLLLRQDKNTGFIYSNPITQASVICIFQTDSNSELINTISHEKNHLEMQIVKAYGLNPYGEEASYLSGEIAELFFKSAILLLDNLILKNRVP